MSSPRIVCINDECPDSRERSSYPPQLRCTGETASAWTFTCDRCAKDGRVSKRVVTKDIAGGTMGQGRRDSGWGTTTGKGGTRFRPGWTSHQ